MIRKAKINDVKAIHKLLEGCKKGVVIPRSLSEIYERLREFFVYVVDDVVVGACALHITWENLSEIRSLAVEEEHKGKGGGKALVRACFDEARTLGIDKMFVLTYIPDFFEAFGFVTVDKSELPHKVWSDCVKCVKFPDCDEVAMIVHMKE